MLHATVPVSQVFSRIAGAAWMASTLGLGITACLGGPTAQAAVVSLDFEGINASYPTEDFAAIQAFYNGGTSSAGTSGTNFGVSFGENALALCLNQLRERCSNTSRGGLGEPSSRTGALFFLSGSETFLNFPSGFRTGFGFNYSSLNYNGRVDVHEGLNGSGNVLAAIDLLPNASDCPGYEAGFCPFTPAGVLFSGTARSIGFGGVANQIVFDDVTFGSAKPGPDGTAVPSPLPLLGPAAAFGYSRSLRQRIQGRGRALAKATALA